MFKRKAEENINRSSVKYQKLDNNNLSILHKQTKIAMNKNEVLKDLAYIHISGIGMQNLQYKNKTVTINSTNFITRCVKNKLCRLRASYLSNLIRNMYLYAPRTTSSIVVYRAYTQTPIGELFNLNKKEEEKTSTLYSPVPFSTSMDKNFTLQWGANHSIKSEHFTILRIIVPKGTPVLALTKPPPNNPGFFNFPYREREVILPPGELIIDWKKTNINFIKTTSYPTMVINQATVRFNPVIPQIIEHNKVTTFTFNQNVVNARESKGAKQIFTFDNKGKIVGNAPNYVKHNGYPFSAAMSAAVAHAIYGISMQ